MSDATQLPFSAIGARVAVAGTLVGLLDGTFALVFYVGLLRACSPAQLSQSIAAALLGDAAYRGGGVSAGLGVALHFAVALSWAAIYAAIWAASATLRALTADVRGAALVGAAFGALVWLAMDLAVLPLTRARPTPVASPIFAWMLAWHTIGVGLPITAFIRAGAREADERLTAQLRCGDRTAFAALTVRYWNAVHRITGSMLPTRSEAAEAAQETFLLAALRSTSWFPSDEPFRTSLYRIAVDQSSLRLRAGQQPIAASLDAFLAKAGATRCLPRPEGEGSSFEERLVKRRDLAERIREELQQVEPLDRAAVALHVSEQLSAEEAAAILRISPGEIRGRTHRALLTLTAALIRLAEVHDT